ncbi:hypothetical protein MANES_13G093564v8 [Manihot esculenta]|uniref:Disease resistance protein RGA3 n=1 Tax=Manihot esculenta TaxID=3983 RepID=A0A2C9URB1_MANES|nr:hypothetical protein MANES_13G093564v8 [Manihot esculenta]
MAMKLFFPGKWIRMKSVSVSVVLKYRNEITSFFRVKEESLVKFRFATPTSPLTSSLPLRSNGSHPSFHVSNLYFFFVIKPMLCYFLYHILSAYFFTLPFLNTYKNRNKLRKIHFQH